MFIVHDANTRACRIEYPRATFERVSFDEFKAFKFTRADLTEAAWKAVCDTARLLRYNLNDTQHEPMVDAACLRIESACFRWRDYREHRIEMAREAELDAMCGR
jgi:hypothetical protein